MTSVTLIVCKASHLDPAGDVQGLLQKHELNKSSARTDLECVVQLAELDKQPAGLLVQVPMQLLAGASLCTQHGMGQERRLASLHSTAADRSEGYAEQGVTNEPHAHAQRRLGLAPEHEVVHIHVHHQRQQRGLALPAEGLVQRHSLELKRVQSLLCVASAKDEGVARACSLADVSAALAAHDAQLSQPAAGTLAAQVADQYAPVWPPAGLSAASQPSWQRCAARCCAGEQLRASPASKQAISDLRGQSSDRNRAGLLALDARRRSAVSSAKTPAGSATSAEAARKAGLLRKAVPGITALPQAPADWACKAQHQVVLGWLS